MLLNTSTLKRRTETMSRFTVQIHILKAIGWVILAAAVLMFALAAASLIKHGVYGVLG